MAFDPSPYNELSLNESPIPGLFVVQLPVHGDNRGWFKENYQKEKQEALGLPPFTVVQNNFSFNDKRGATRGLHAEPWEKFISVANGSVFGAWCDLRFGDSFGRTFSIEINPGVAVFVPRGVANGYQTLEDNVTYTYLVNEHWSPDAEYEFVNLFDPAIGIEWPISQAEAIISEKDTKHPYLHEIKRKKMVINKNGDNLAIVGANGQLGKELQKKYPNARAITKDLLDITSQKSVQDFNWNDVSVLINAAAYTNVDGAETPEGRRAAWRTNAYAVSYLAKACRENNMTLIHISSDYVFDGSQSPHLEDEDVSPLNVYGQTKAAGDSAASSAPRHYVIRTSWVIGDGNNFVRTMRSLATKGVKPKVVNDQIGRLTFTGEIVSGIDYLLQESPEYGIYNLTNDGPSVSWADIAAEVYELLRHSRNDVKGVSTKEYYKDTDEIAPRPLESTLSLDKIKHVGFKPQDWQKALKKYISDGT